MVTILLIVLQYWPAAAGVPQKKAPVVYFDNAQFRAKTPYTYVEFYFGVPRAGLTYLASERGLEANYAVGYTVSLGDSVITRSAWLNVNTADNISEAHNDQQLLETAGLYLEPGTYDLELTLRDVLGDTTVTAERELTVRSFPEHDLSLSSIQLALKMSRSDEEGKFVKNGYYMLPNAYGVYGNDWPALYYYTEIYGLRPLAAGDDSCYTASGYVLDGAGDKVLSLPARRRLRAGDAVVNPGSVDLTDLRTGKYTLCLTVYDHAGSDTVKQVKDFFIYRSNDFDTTAVIPADVAYVRNPAFMNLTIHEADSLAERLIYTAREGELDLYKTLDLEGKRRFLDAFWNKRDSQPDTRENEYMTRYFEHIRYTETRYSSGRKPGYKTDRGRVYMVYGEPDQIDTFPNNMGIKPYEVWSYHSLETGAEFVFIDRSGFGDYILVHSTARGETRDENWQEKWLQ